MTIKTERTCKITVVLSEDEAKALRTLLQNCAGDPGVEPEPFKTVRVLLFTELHEALGGYNPAG